MRGGSGFCEAYGLGLGLRWQTLDLTLTQVFCEKPVGVDILQTIEVH